MYQFSYQLNFPWAELKRILNSPFAKTAAPWLVITPVAARLLKDAPDAIKVGELTLGIGLPFSWVSLFFAALFIFIARCIYLIKCPRLIRDYSSYTDLQSQGTTPRQLLAIVFDDCEKAIGSADTNHADHIVHLVVAEDYQEYVTANAERTRSYREKGNWISLIPLVEYLAHPVDSYADTDAKLSKNAAHLYWVSSNILEFESNKVWRSVVTLLIAIGLFLSAILLLQAIWFVLSISI